MNTCPACNEPRLGRYCNDGHAMRRTRPMTEAEWAVWYEEHNRAYLGGMADGRTSGHETRPDEPTEGQWQESVQTKGRRRARTAIGLALALGMT